MQGRRLDSGRKSGDERCTKSDPGPNSGTGCVPPDLRQLAALDRLAGVFASLGSAPRLRLLFLLHLRPELNVGQLSEMTGLTVSGVSTHLRRLRESGLVCCRRNGRAVCCTLPEDGDHVQFLCRLFCQIAAESGCGKP